MCFSFEISAISHSIRLRWY